ncbi:MAG TPA: hypothetical protein VEO54_17175 [Thermoanaerobaculia bacterium]|nr:hypothetical protein [Thermoanaerobaculia bacterium]
MKKIADVLAGLRQKEARLRLELWGVQEIAEALQAGGIGHARATLRQRCARCCNGTTSRRNSGSSATKSTVAGSSRSDTAVFS